MRLKTVRITNFRGIKETLAFDLSSLTTIIGRNDVGKSTILDALDIFFNAPSSNVKMSLDDVNKSADKEANGKRVNVEISCIFEDLPESIIIDEIDTTSFREECLLNVEGNLEVIKVYPDGGTEKCFLVGKVFPLTEYSKIFTIENKGLKKLAKDVGAICSNLSSNVKIRSSIRNMYGRNDVEIGRLEFSGERLTKLLALLPRFALFRADRENGIADDEFQTPSSLVVNAVLDDEEIKSRLDYVKTKVTSKLDEFFSRVVRKMSSFDAEIVRQFQSKPKNDVKWANAFKGIVLKDENEISLDKRGSGVRRIALLCSFIAYIEMLENLKGTKGIIYAIEEPETGQHSDNQGKLITALKKLSCFSNIQVLLTTHSGHLLKCLYGQDAAWSLYDKAECPDVKIVERKSGKCTLTDTRTKYGGVLPYASYSEISYLLLKDCVLEYHEELYGFLEKNGLVESCEKYIFSEKAKAREEGKSWTRQHNRKKGEAKERGLHIFVRDMIHHPENKSRSTLREDDVRTSIMLMRKFLWDKGLRQIKCKAEHDARKLCEARKRLLQVLCCTETRTDSTKLGIL